MNNPHQNARLTVYGREQIVARVAAGQSASEVAQAFGVSVRTVRKWLARFREGGPAALQNRSSSPRRVSAPVVKPCRATGPASSCAVGARPGRFLCGVAWTRRVSAAAASARRAARNPRPCRARKAGV
ncbi:putative insertion sequence transposase protein [Rhodovulum sulfidophilum]|uniref:Putative insertion sequence transposase protein n=1 Tax=Rhodovulum sulfidophilum TaxID=35806 RepID=A0A0D6AXF6_RHOSU|nr:putative insertion sequence transposase protein [Rhodovulum sulfidophilum]